MFPDNESQVYEFTTDATYKVEARDGNFTVWRWDEYPDTGPRRDWDELYQNDTEYWLGVVYAYKMTDDDTRNVYTTADYNVLAKVCHYLQQVPTFAELEDIILYTRACVPYSCWDWRKRADAWLRRQDLNRARPNRHAEGAD